MLEAIQNDFWAKLAEAEDRFFSAEEQYHEMESEYKGECAAFGDAGPGAWLNLIDQELEVKYRRQAYESLEAQMAA